jgi:hypothetical protein
MMLDFLLVFVFELTAVLVLGFIYFAFYLPLLSEPYPGGIAEVVRGVRNVKLVELRHLVSQEMTEQIAQYCEWERKKLTRWRPKAIAERLEPAEANVRLCLAFARWEFRKIRKKPAGPRSEQERLIEELYRQAQVCSMALMFAKVIRVLAFWDTERLIRFHREVVLDELRACLFVLLQVAGTYGRHHRENMLAWLDCWELDDDYCQSPS